MKENSVIDLFCYVGGLSYGLKQAGLKIIAGYDLDKTCKYAYEKNIKAKFIQKNIKAIFPK
ncbi:DNA cytosine methyltransferase [Campylobacter bilis]|uniref:DNA cytosine methyltransferase n=1 Tax=Campylobacter bilis TaxID=2691918 RepID=UPI0022391ECB|nr:DNA cytosine methyltransferase [Campylobacter bilis]